MRAHDKSMAWRENTGALRWNLSANVRGSVGIFSRRPIFGIYLFVSQYSSGELFLRHSVTAFWDGNCLAFGLWKYYQSSLASVFLSWYKLNRKCVCVWSDAQSKNNEISENKQSTKPHHRRSNIQSQGISSTGHDLKASKTKPLRRHVMKSPGGVVCRYSLMSSKPGRRYDLSYFT